jgi:hypothetical protein
MQIGYARVSTKEQGFDLQVDALRQARCAKVFQEVVSGAKAERPVLETLLANLRPGDVPRALFASSRRAAGSSRALAEQKDVWALTLGRRVCPSGSAMLLAGCLSSRGRTLCAWPTPHR